MIRKTRIRTSSKISKRIIRRETTGIRRINNNKIRPVMKIRIALKISKDLKDRSHLKMLNGFCRPLKMKKKMY